MTRGVAVSNKRVNVLALARSGLHGTRVINFATEPDADAEYIRRLRLWAADCAAHCLNLIAWNERVFSEAATAIRAARRYARGLTEKSTLAPFQNHTTCDRCIEGKDALFNVREEASLSAVMAAQEDVWLGARCAARHARQAVMNAAIRVDRQATDPDSTAYVDELRWQTDRLILRLDATEPWDWPVQIDRK